MPIHDQPRRDGSVTLEIVAVLPLVALVVAGVLQLLGVARSVLTASDAARTGARAAAAAGSAEPAVVAAHRAARPIPVDVSVTPPVPVPGELVTVRVATTVRLGPAHRRITTAATALVEPGAGWPGSEPAPPGGG